MGSSSWSDSFYKAREVDRAKTGTSAFTYDASVRSSGGPAKVHDKMDPKGLKMRESRDSDAHPESVPVAVWFDVTGSNASQAVILQKKFGGLMAILLKKGYLAHPQVMFSAIGDATCDGVPLQVGQFESGLEMDDNLGMIFLESGGGGQMTESYELAMYTMARHTSCDAWEKRGKKGYLFMIGDEMAYSRVKKHEVEKLIGPELEADILTKDIIEELKEKWEVFFLIPVNSSHGRDPNIKNYWINLFGQNTIMLEDSAAICESIAMAIGLAEGAIDLDAGAEHLKEAGVGTGTVSVVSRALSGYASATALARPASATAGLPAAPPMTGALRL